jgi:hypothetical protein
MPGRRQGVSRRVAIPAALVAASIAGGLLPASLLGAPQPTVTVSLGTHNVGAAVPADFLGLSFEAEAVGRLALFRPGGELDALLASLGRGVIRFGGVSADKSAAWVPDGAPAPPWARTAFSRADLARIAAVAQLAGWRALWTLGLGHYEPLRGAREAAAARALFGPALLGVEIGNEPDAFVKEGFRTSGWSLPLWLRQIAAYRRAIAWSARGAPMAAPDAASGIRPLKWVRAAARSHPRLLTDHFYPLTSCGYMRPPISQLLGSPVRAGEDAMLARLATISHARATPLRIDETNDVSCHGEAGVSDSFASALWAVDWTVRVMHAGLAGLNFHDLLDEPGAYSPLILRAGALHAKPEWYGLLMAARLAGQRPLLDGTLNDSSLTVAGFLGPGRRPSLSIVLVDFEPPGSAPLAVHLRVPGRYRAGTVLRLTGPSPAALSGVTLGGSEVGADGRWRPRLPLPVLRASHGACELSISPSSAALVTLTAR